MIVFLSSTDTLMYAKTTDGGATWGSTGTISSTGDLVYLSAWFDQETPGDSGTLIHMAYLDRDNDQCLYRTIDISDASLGTERSSLGDVTAVEINGSTNKVAITKARNGNLIVAFTTEADNDCVRSTNGGVTWIDRANPFESANQPDWLLLYPANVDAGDIAGIFWDASADAISVKMFDESGNTWNETAILSSMVEDAYDINMDGAVMHSDGKIYCVAHSNDDDAGDDLRAFIVNPNSIASPGIDTTPANIFTNQAESAGAAIQIDQFRDNIRVAHLKGNPTWTATVDVVYHESTDKMASWGSEQAYSEAAADDLRRVHAGRTVGGNNEGGFFQPVFFNDDLSDLFVNTVNDVSITKPGAGRFPRDRRTFRNSMLVR